MLRDIAYEAIGGTGTYYIHDNVIHDAISECFMIGNGSDSYYVWNNVIYQGGSGNCNPFHFPQNGLANAAGFLTFWDNIMVPEAGVQCFLQVGSPAPGWNAVTIQNTLCVTTGVLRSGINATTITADHNSVMTPTQATAAGMTSSEMFAYSSPTSNCAAQPNCPIGIGVNLTAAFGTAGIATTNDTSYACSQIAGSGGQVVSCPQRTQKSRPAGSSVWDESAYMFVSAGGATGSAISGGVQLSPGIVIQ